MKKTLLAGLATGVLMFGVVCTTEIACANIVDSGLDNGLGTFTDTITGNIWLDLDNFSGKSFNDMKVIAYNAGYSIATYDELETLLASLLSPNLHWTEYTQIMSSNTPNREQMWGAYDILSNTNHNWAYAFSNDTLWQFVSDGTPINSFAYTNEWGDLNLWAYKTGHDPVPEPATLILFGTGLAGLAAARRRKKAC